MYGDKSPCLGCEPPKKKLCCHQFCKEYIAWTEEEHKKKDWVKEQLHKNYTMSESARRKIWKSMKKERR